MQLYCVAAANKTEHEQLLCVAVYRESVYVKFVASKFPTQLFLYISCVGCTIAVYWVSGIATEAHKGQLPMLLLVAMVISFMFLHSVESFSYSSSLLTKTEMALLKWF